MEARAVAEVEGRSQGDDGGRRKAEGRRSVGSRRRRAVLHKKTVKELSERHSFDFELRLYAASVLRLTDPIRFVWPIAIVHVAPVEWLCRNVEWAAVVRCHSMVE